MNKLLSHNNCTLKTISLTINYIIYLIFFRDENVGMTLTCRGESGDINRTLTQMCKKLTSTAFAEFVCQTRTTVGPPQSTYAGDTTQTVTMTPRDQSSPFTSIKGQLFN